MSPPAHNCTCLPVKHAQAMTRALVEGEDIAEMSILNEGHSSDGVLGKSAEQREREQESIR